MFYSELEERVIDAWIEASCKFHFRIDPKYRLKDSDRERQTLFFLPDYGGANGMVVVGTAPPDLAIDSELAQAAKRTGVFCSFINLEKYERFDEATFAEALEDWKYPYEKPPVET